MGKNLTVEVEFVDEPLEYNILIGRPWVYAMAAVVSTYFCMIIFPHKGSIKTIDQLLFFTVGSQATGSILFIHGLPPSLQNIGVGLFKDPSLMGTFSLSSPVTSTEIANMETFYRYFDQTWYCIKNSCHCVLFSI